MKHLVSLNLHAYWDRLRGARAAPERSDLDPAAIRPILADTLLMEVVHSQRHAGRDIIIRLSGTRVDAIWQRDLKGCALASLWRADDRDTLRDITDLVLDDQVPVVIGACGDFGDVGSTEIEMLLLPLRCQGKTHTRLLGSVALHEPRRRLGAQATGPLTLTSFRRIEPAASGQFQRPRSASAPFSSAPARRGRFMVYEGGRGSANDLNARSIVSSSFRHP